MGWSGRSRRASSPTLTTPACEHAVSTVVPRPRTLAKRKRSSWISGSRGPGRRTSCGGRRGRFACRIVTRLPVHLRKRFQTTDTVTSRQNARRTPGESALLTSVELSEKATTTPTTANAPDALALNETRRLPKAIVMTEPTTTRQERSRARTERTEIDGEWRISRRVRSAKARSH